VGDLVVDGLSVALRFHNAFGLELSQVLRQRRLRKHDQLRKVADALLLLRDVAQDHQAFRIADSLKQRRRSCGAMLHFSGNSFCNHKNIILENTKISSGHNTRRLWEAIYLKSLVTTTR